MTDNPKAEILLSVYGQKSFLPACLKGLANQTWNNFIVLCYVDRNDEESRGILEACAEKDERFQLCYADQQAVSEEINRELKNMESEYVVFLKPGDLCKERYLESGMKLAEQYDPQMVLFDSGKREMRFGNLRNDIHMLKKQLLPGKDIFSSEEITGNRLSVVQKPTRLTMYQTGFLLSLNIFLQENERNDLYVGRCALASAEKICAVREQQAYLFTGERCFPADWEEMKAFHRYLQEHHRLEQQRACFANAVLMETAASMRMVNTDAERYEILKALDTEPLFEEYLTEPEEKAFPSSGKEAQFLLNARKRYRIIREGQHQNPEETCLRQNTEDSPEVSIIVPVYNTEEYVEEAVRSAMDQTLKNIEILCYDDGSTDGSLDILLRLADEDHRISVYKQENCGLSISRNRAIQRARGEYLFFLDSDDLLVSDAMATAYAKAKSEGLDLLLFNAENYYDDTFTTEEGKNREGKLLTHHYENIKTGAELLLERHNHYEAFANVWLELVKRDFLIREHISFIEKIYYEDVAYSYEVQLKAKKASYLDAVLHKRRIRENSITTAKRTLDHSYGIFRALVKMLTVFQETENRLTEAQRDAARYRMKTVLNSARNVFLETGEEIRGEEYGLGEDSALFRSLISSYCEQAKTAVSQKKKSNSLQKKTEKLEAVQAQQNRAIKDGEERIQQAEEEIETLKKQNLQLKNKLGETTQELRVRANEEKKREEKSKTELSTLAREKAQLEKQLKKEREYYSDILNSYSYRIGRGLTWPIRKLRTLIRR